MKLLPWTTIGLALVLIGCAEGRRAQEQRAAQWRAQEAESNRKVAEAQEANKARRETYVQAHPEYGRWILNQQIALGMSTDDVIASWGAPANVNRSVSAYGTNEQWVYYYIPGVVPPGVISTYGSGISTIYVYLDNGRVSSWQQSQ